MQCLKLQNDPHLLSVYKPIYQDGLALLSALYSFNKTKKSVSKRFAFTSNTQQSFKSRCEQGCLLKRDSKNVPKMISKVPEVEG